uniref:Uncharacterized protein n=1 Tax=Stegastes partitus TaxID=144197 RepID=A0A3B4ZNW7_9TELE
MRTLFRISQVWEVIGVSFVCFFFFLVFVVLRQVQLIFLFLIFVFLPHTMWEELKMGNSWTNSYTSLFIYVAGKEETYDTTGRTSYMRACEMLQVAPASYFLQHMQDSELKMMHRGLGPQGTKALAVPLVTNTSILRLNLRDNWMEGMGGAAIAEMLKENCYITGGFTGHSTPRPRPQLSGRPNR